MPSVGTGKTSRSQFPSQDRRAWSVCPGRGSHDEKWSPKTSSGSPPPRPRTRNRRPLGHKRTQMKRRLRASDAARSQGLARVRKGIASDSKLLESRDTLTIKQRVLPAAGTVIDLRQSGSRTVERRRAVKIGAPGARSVASRSLAIILNEIDQRGTHNIMRRRDMPIRGRA